MQLRTQRDETQLRHYDHLKIGEKLSHNLSFLEEQGLVSRITLTATKSAQNILPTIVTKFDEMVKNGDFLYPEILPEPVYTAQTGHDTVLRNLLINSPFQLVKIGSNGSTNGPKLAINENPKVDSFAFGKFLYGNKRDVCKDPDDNKTILLFFCKCHFYLSMPKH